MIIDGGAGVGGGEPGDVLLANSGGSVGIGPFTELKPPLHTLDVIGDGNFTSSVTASAFFGDGSHLTGIITSGLDSTKLPLTGGTLTGTINLTGANTYINNLRRQYIS